jgi:sugar-specific transcriptional regulator TrmB
MQPQATKPLISPTPPAFSHCGLGGVGLEGVEVFVGLGLTGGQARVYLVLLKVGIARAQVVARLALVHRQEVYYILENLQQIGLVHQNVTVPATYSATPIVEGVKLLLDQKTSELTLMSRKAEWLAQKLNQTLNAPTSETKKPCFGAIYEGDRGKKYCQAIEKTHNSINIITSWIRFKKTCFLFETQLKAALNKNITLQIISEKPSNHHLPRWVNIALSKHPNFNLKIVPTPPATAFTIFDQSTAMMAFNANTLFTKGPEFWTTHPGLILTCQCYFNNLWSQT